VDGGYYTKTPENLPLVGPAPGPHRRGAAAGAFLCAGVSGYGIMAAHAAGELAALLVDGRGEDLLPPPAPPAAPAAAAAAAAARPVKAGDAAQVRAAGYAATLSPLRHQDEAFMRPGGGRDRLLAAGGGQL